MQLEFHLQPPSESAASGVGTRNKTACAECGASRSGQKPGRYCGPICRIRASKRRRAEAEARRNRGKAIAAANCAEELETARKAALAVLSEIGVGIVSHVRDYCDMYGMRLDWSKNWPGSLFQHEWFEPTGRRCAAFHKASDARKVNEYQLTAAGWAAWRGNKS